MTVSPTPSHTFNVSVIIPVYHGGDKFRQSLLGIVSTCPPPGEVIVVADGHTDGAWLLAENLGSKVLKIPISGGPARARNAGAAEAKGEVLFFVDADVVVPPDVIGRIGSAFHDDPELAALIGSYDDDPGEANFLSQYKNLFHHYIHQTSHEEASTFWGACGAMRRDVFLKIGGFDEGYRQSSIEDIELGYRLRQSGYKIRLFKEIQVKHLKYWGITSLLKTDFLDRAVPWTELILRHGSLINDLNLRLSNRISVMLIYGILIAAVSALWWSKAPAFIIAFIIALVGINLPVYRFFLRKRGFWFMMKAIPWHWLYYFYSGLAFTVGLAKYSLSTRDHKK